MLLGPEELQQFQNHSSQMAALDFMVSISSNIFIPTYDGNMAKLVEGHRRYLYSLFTFKRKQFCILYYVFIYFYLFQTHYTINPIKRSCRRLLISRSAGTLDSENPSYSIGKHLWNCQICIRMELFHGVSLELPSGRHMRKGWGRQPVEELFQTSTRRKITFTQILRNVSAREQIVMTYQALAPQEQYGEEVLKLKAQLVYLWILWMG